jgi:hypothetical protein
MTLFPCPPELQSLARLFWHEEMASTVRHHVRNKLSSVRNSIFYIRRKVQEDTQLVRDDPRVGQFFQLIETELEACSSALTMQLPPVGEAALIDLKQAAADLLRKLVFPPGTSVEVSAAPSTTALIAPSELELALFFVLEYAVARKAGVLHLATASSTAKEAALELSGPLPPGSSTPGLKIAKRIVSRWSGRVEEGRGPNGDWLLTLWLPREAKVNP